MRHAVFTIVQDEPFFFPLWCRYYRDHYSARHMYVLYHPLPDEETSQPAWLHTPLALTNINLVRIFRDESFDHKWLREQVERFAAFLLGSYDTVTFTEVDEIVATDPTKSAEYDLVTWLDGWYCRDQPAVRCNGYEVVHRYDTEPGLDTAKVMSSRIKVLKDRGWWYPSSLYSKTLIWRVPPRWGNGFHDAYAYFADATGRYAPLDLPREPELLLIHLHKLDYQEAVMRWRRTAARTWNKEDLRNEVGLQNRFQTEDQLQKWWYLNIDNQLTGNAPLVPIPDAVRDIV
jgi:hypothetical protein